MPRTTAAVHSQTNVELRAAISTAAGFPNHRPYWYTRPGRRHSYDCSTGSDTINPARTHNPIPPSINQSANRVRCTITTATTTTVSMTDTIASGSRVSKVSNVLPARELVRHIKSRAATDVVPPVPAATTVPTARPVPSEKLPSDKRRVDFLQASTVARPATDVEPRATIHTPIALRTEVRALLPAYIQEWHAAAIDTTDHRLLHPNNRPPTMTSHTFTVYGKPFTIDAHYRFEHPLGRGSFASVALCHDERNVPVAVKHVENYLDDLTDARCLLREIRVMMHCHHPCLRSLSDIVEPFPVHHRKHRSSTSSLALSSGDMMSDSKVTPLTKIAPSKSVSLDHLYLVSPAFELVLRKATQQPRYTRQHARFFLYQLLCAVRYLHHAGIVHRDLKPDNLLVNVKDCSLCVADFGLSRGVELDDRAPGVRTVYTEYVVTRWYRSPELLGRGPNTKGIYNPTKVDMWSIGCIFAELLRPGDAILPGKDPLDQLRLIVQLLGTPTVAQMELLCPIAQQMLAKLATPQVTTVRKSEWAVDWLTKSKHGSDPHAVDLLTRLMAFHPNDRLSADEALAHPYFTTCPEVRGWSQLYHTSPASTLDDSFERQLNACTSRRDLRIRLQDFFWQALVSKRPHCTSMHVRWRKAVCQWYVQKLESRALRSDISSMPCVSDVRVVVPLAGSSKPAAASSAPLLSSASQPNTTVAARPSPLNAPVSLVPTSVSSAPSTRMPPFADSKSVPVVSILTSTNQRALQFAPVHHVDETSRVFVATTTGKPAVAPPESDVPSDDITGVLIDMDPMTACGSLPSSTSSRDGGGGGGGMTISSSQSLPSSQGSSASSSQSHTPTVARPLDEQQHSLDVETLPIGIHLHN